MYLDAQDSEHLMLSLTDTGRPVLPEYTGAVFDLLMQWRLRQQGSRTSIAWGLPFCRTALRAMGADIRVESSADGGQTRFVILLPLDT
jgi:signal transduction histidine kinase